MGDIYFLADLENKKIYSFRTYSKPIDINIIKDGKKITKQAINGFVKRINSDNYYNTELVIDKIIYNEFMNEEERKKVKGTSIWGSLENKPILKSNSLEIIIEKFNIKGGNNEY